VLAPMFLWETQDEKLECLYNKVVEYSGETLNASWQKNARPFNFLEE